MMYSPTASITRPPGDDLAQTDGELVATTGSLGGVLRRHVEEGERQRRLPAATANALGEAGLFRLCRSRELGGLEADPLTVFDVVEELARHDGSAAWCALNCGIASVLQSFLAADGASEIGDSPDVIVNGVIAPTGRAVEVEGGYLVRGRWSFVSNCHHCTWLALSCVAVADYGAPTNVDEPQIVMTFVPASHWQLIDTWHTVGLRATGSHDIEVSDLFVPSHRSISMPPTEPIHDSALARFPLVGLFAVGMAACAIGLARAALDEVLELAHTKTPFGMPSTLATRATIQIALSEAIATTRSARALVVQETHRMWQAVQTGTPPTAEQRALLRIATTHATAAAATAADRAYTAAGSSAIFASSPLQRHLRDIHTLTQHFFVASPTYEMTGKVLLGVEPDGFML